MSFPSPEAMEGSLKSIASMELGEAIKILDSLVKRKQAVAAQYASFGSFKGPKRHKGRKGQICVIDVFLCCRWGPF